MKKQLMVVGGRLKSVYAAAGGVALLAGSNANAALDTEVTDLITGLVTDVGLLFGACVALWAAIRGFAAVFKLGNKFISKAGA